jgi:hypothetical protein
VIVPGEVFIKKLFCGSTVSKLEIAGSSSMGSGPNCRGEMASEVPALTKTSNSATAGTVKAGYIGNPSGGGHIKASTVGVLL